MSNDFSQFMKSNKKVRPNQFFAATKSICDEDGKPVKWEFKPIDTKTNDRIREACTMEVPVKGKAGQYRNKIDITLYQKKMICASVVFPDLNDKDLQDSYGVMCAEDLLTEMVDEAGEFAELSAFVQNISGFTTLQEDVDEAKN